MPLSDGQRERIYRLAQGERNYIRFFQYLSQLQHNMKQSAVTVVENHSNLNRKASLDLMRKIADIGVAKVHPGGGGQTSYLAWEEGVDIREVGRSADQPLR
ncbi:MAG: hypothetical protein NT015_00145 [Alphaproteobacteria bacterium]|nr:hypothetical protein [Alphaproteobacteria bacterium]